MLYMTDDQRADTLWVMAEVQERLVERGVVFERAYAQTPLCSPTRASILAGGFPARDTHVLSNRRANGAPHGLDLSLAMPRRLHEAGYRTGFIGKYLHHYSKGAVPPGWDTWVRPEVSEDWLHYECYTGSSDEGYGATTTTAVDQYHTDYITEAAVAFIEDAGSDPFFLWVAPFAPHAPYTPADEDAGSLDGETWRGGAFNEPDVRDKPAWLQEREALDADSIAAWDEQYAHHLETLLAVDRSVAALLDALEAAGRLDDTVFVYTSDNGLQWGEHRLYGKGLPYEESARVPLVVLAPGVPPRTEDRLVSVSTDLAATVQDLAGLDAYTAGASLVPLVWEEPTSWRTSLFMEGYDDETSPDWAAVVTPRWKYVEYTDGATELYDLARDPAEETSLHGRSATARIVAGLDGLLEAEKGLAVRTDALELPVGVAVDQALEAWGGTAPLTWTTGDGALPDGLALAGDGVLGGTPTATCETQLSVTVQDSSASAYDGAPRAHTASVRFTVTE